MMVLFSSQCSLMSGAISLVFSVSCNSSSRRVIGEKPTSIYFWRVSSMLPEN